jgi:hypothetical protein
VALPADLVGAVLAGPLSRGRTFNALVREALEQYVARRRDAEFEEEMRRMAEDPQIQAETRAILRDLEGTDADGLDRVG